MSKRGYISRYLLILKKLKKKPYSSFEELNSYFNSQIDILQMQDTTLNIGFSRRTFQRDIKEIRDIFGVDIEYSKYRKGYFISHNEIENMNFQRVIEAFDMFNSFKLIQDLQPFIHVEKRRPQGTENLYGLLHTIKNNLQIKFAYHKLWEEEHTIRIVEPYALKEFKNRWYVLAKDVNDRLIKSFALDRISNFEITKISFDNIKTSAIEDNYRYCFGIISPNGKKPATIILSFNPYQGKYIKSLPLHDTQQILIDNENELQIRLRICVTLDFVMELLSFGDNVKVIKPKTLVKEIKKILENTIKQYC